ncbi:hypothetical protein [Paraburkholderia lacunae]|uniref:hypothetical protein n=1 Tax=Paraburkholderia lacunae TaxID=2211104 RepID=UPI00140361F3|nr:hypothetical protein [Paraburkholderia lacunae]
MSASEGAARYEIAKRERAGRPTDCPALKNLKTMADKMAFDSILPAARVAA